MIKKYALLCGSAPDGKRQKKINNMYKFLTTSAPGDWNDNEILIFPNGIDEKTLSFIINKLRKSGTKLIYTYLCSIQPIRDTDSSIWLCGNEIQKKIFLNDIYSVFDFDSQFLSEDEFYCDDELTVLLEQLNNEENFVGITYN